MYISITVITIIITTIITVETLFSITTVCRTGQKRLFLRMTKWYRLETRPFS